jgi:hypothetical protein
VSAGLGRSASSSKERTKQLANKGDTAEKKQKKTEAKVSSPTKKKWPRSRAKSNKAGRGFDVGMNLTLEGQMMSGQKRKSV